MASDTVVSMGLAEERGRFGAFAPQPEGNSYRRYMVCSWAFKRLPLSVFGGYLCTFNVLGPFWIDPHGRAHGGPYAAYSEATVDTLLCHAKASILNPRYLLFRIRN